MMAISPRFRVSIMSGPESDGHIATPHPRVIGAMAVPMSGSTWCSGSSMRVRRLPLNIGTSSATPCMFASRFSYDSITPFGEPVVPEVYIMRHGSTLPDVFSKRNSCPSATSRGSGTLSSNTITVISTPASRMASRASCSFSREVKMHCGRQSFMIYATSCTVLVASTGTAMASLCHTAKKAYIHSERFSLSIKVFIFSPSARENCSALGIISA